MLDISIKTTKSTKKMLDNFPKDTRKALFNGMIKASLFLETETKKSFGRIGYPKVRTGHLRRSIYSKALERSSQVIGIIGTNVIYGSFLEEGTKKMTAKPFLKPTILRNQLRLSAILTDSIAKELNR